MSMTYCSLADLIENIEVVKVEMKKLSSLNENSEVGVNNLSPSSGTQTDRSFTDTTVSGDDSFAYCRTTSETSMFSEPTEDENSPRSWSAPKSAARSPPVLSRLGMKQYAEVADEIFCLLSEFELMRERFSKLLLGEDMSGGGKGVCTSVAISNAITNLYATVFGQNLRLEPLAAEKKTMWRREMDCLLSVCDYIVEFVPSSQNQSSIDGRVRRE